MLSLSFEIANRSAPPALKIFIVSGGGYAGSIYRASRPGGQWFADGSPIAGATGLEWTMTQALEGAAINYRLGSQNSNAIEMWMPTDLAASYRTNGGWWDPKRTVTVANGKVSAVADQFGIRAMTQTNTANQPDFTAAAPEGGPAIVWPDTANSRYLAPPAAFSPAYWMFVIRYRNGTIANFPSDGGTPEGDYPAIVSSGVSPYRVMGERGLASLYQGSVWAGSARKNGAATETTMLLPLPKSLVELQGSPASAGWSLGRSGGTLLDDPSTARSWRGAMFEILALGAAPSAETRALLQGCVAWRNGIRDMLPDGHRYKASGPMKI